jgi:hypothetical protein
MKHLHLTERHKMLLIIVFGIIASLFTYDLKAQSVTIGPKLGFTNTTAAGDDLPDDVESISGFVGGAFIKFQASPVFAVQPEILYHQKGAFWNPSDNTNFKYTFEYLEIPVLLKLQLPLGETVYPFVYAGPYAAFTMSNNVEGEFIGFEASGTEDLNDFDGGAVLGGGLDIQVNQLFLGFDARYGIGMRNVFDDDPDNQRDIKNRSFSAMLSLGVNL